MLTTISLVTFSLKSSAIEFEINNQFLKSEKSTRINKLKVRIGLRTTLNQNLNRKNLTSKENLQINSKTLRADLSLVNHFYFENIHVQTIPKYWNRENNTYKIELNFSLRVRQGDQVEEEIGSVYLKGNLINKKENAYILNGIVEKNFKDKFGKTKLKILAGFQPLKKDLTKIANGNKSKSRLESLKL